MPNGSRLKHLKKIVENGYDQVASQYARLEDGESWPRMRWLPKLLHQLPHGSSVLDLGCGSGDPADILIAQRHRITGVDISREQVERARRNVPSGTFLHADAASVRFPEASFDAVVSFYTFEHIPRAEHAALLASVHSWLRPGGFLLLSLETEDVEGHLGEWLGVPMFFSSFGPEMVLRLIEDARFEILEIAVETQVEQSTEIPYLWVLAMKD
jgi:cyclopropane fatty-acyl-phospholipid synthase-like methyltransferase